MSDRRIESLRETIADLGFDLVGITPSVQSAGYSKLIDWIDAGYCGEMNYFADRIDAYRHPDAVMLSTSSIIVMTFPYPNAPVSQVPTGVGKVARYAWTGADYHDVIHPKLKRLRSQLSSLYPGANSRGIVDTAPLMEREVAQLAGIGWRAKNTLIINKHRGSYFFLACLLTDQTLPYDQEHETDHCGTCTACLDACPTDAFPMPGVMDASRCISYLTIEHRGAIPVDLRSEIGDWVFGCDVCQEVCPWNQKNSNQKNHRREEWKSHGPASELKDHQAPSIQMSELALYDLFELNEDEFRIRFRKTPLWRTRRRGILRNAAIVLGNQRDTKSLTALGRGISDHEPLVRGASAWAMGQIGGEDAHRLLRQRLEEEVDSEVIKEIKAALP